MLLFEIYINGLFFFILKLVAYLYYCPRQRNVSVGLWGGWVQELTALCSLPRGHVGCSWI